jgi:hypothetical protein
MQSATAANRPLMVYAFDPSQGRSLGNYMTVRVPYEDLQTGPKGPYIEIIDYDATNKKYYQPVNLDDRVILLQGGLYPTESDPRFHQQMVYAVSRETMHHFERALGRKLKFGYRTHEALRIYPHAMQEANAYYDRNLKGIVFGYFAASTADAGSNLPNQTIFTCLSHDIVAHETTHAILDGQRPFFMQDTNPDVLAFHEGFADIVALFQHFSYEEALYCTMIRTGGAIHRADVAPTLMPSGGEARIGAELRRSNPLIDLARQFGESMGKRAALRNALMTAPNSRDIETTFEPHARGAILVAAIFDAYFTSLQNRTADLFRIARAGGAQVMANDVHPDLAHRLCQEATKLAQHFLAMCIRAIDYAPPVDVTFGDYLRALVTADFDLYPDDPFDYREALIESFRCRGIHPDNVTSMAEDSLRWNNGLPPNAAPPVCKDLQFDLMNGQTDEMQKHNGQTLSNFAAANAAALRLASKVDKQPQAFSFHPLIRTNDGFAAVQIVTELMQRKDVLLDPNNPQSTKIRMYGGSTVHFDADGTVRYVIHKRIDDPEREQRQREYWEAKRDAELTLVERAETKAIDTTVNFAAVHRGF